MRPHNTHIIEEYIKENHTKISAECIDCKTQGLSYGDNPAGIIASTESPNPETDEDTFNKSFALVVTIMINHSNTNHTPKPSMWKGKSK